ncbi:hypothetical protein CHUAL_003180 [Chamberlinius hualienensis]
MVASKVTAIDDYWEKNWKLFRLMYFILGININPAVDQPDESHSIIKLYQIIVFILISLGVTYRCSHMANYVVPAMWTDPTAFYHVGIFCITVSTVVIYLVILTNQNQISTFFRQLIHHLSLNCDSYQLQKFTKKWYIVQFVMVSMTLLLLAVGSIAIILTKEDTLMIQNDSNCTEASKSIPLIGYTIFNNQAITKLMQIISLEISTYTILYTVTFAWVCSALYLAMISIQLPKVLNGKEITLNDADTELQKFQFQHEKVSKLIRTANRQFSFLNMSVSFLEMVDLIFVVTVQKVSSELLQSGMYVNLLFSLTLLFSKNHVGSKVNDIVTESLRFIQSIDLFGYIPSHQRRFITQVHPAISIIISIHIYILLELFDAGVRHGGHSITRNTGKRSNNFIPRRQGATVIPAAA